jgi:hypothetical protein
MKISHPILSSLLLAVLATSARSAGISINFAGDGQTLATGAAAGVVSMTNWNNAMGRNGTGVSLVDSGGSPTAAQLTYSAGEYSDNTTRPFVLNGWHVRTVPNTPDANTNQLWRGSLVGYNDIGEISISVSGIPYSLYDVYVYAGVNSVVSAGGMTVSDGVTSFSIHSPTTATAPTSLTQNTGSVTAYGVWQVFSGKTGSTFSLNTSGGFAYDATEVYALQIVNVVPEPATAALAGLGVIGCLVRRRRS